jgi:hypothetical protein
VRPAINLTLLLVGLTVGLWAGSAWERFAMEQQHDDWVFRAAACQGAIGQLNTSAAKCSAQLEWAQNELTESNAAQLVEARLRQAQAIR